MVMFVVVNSKSHTKFLIILNCDTFSSIIFINIHKDITLYCIIFITHSFDRSKVGNCRRGWPEGSLFNSFYTSLDCSTLPLIHTIRCWVLGKEASSTIFIVFGMTWPGIEPQSPESLANTLTIMPMVEANY